MAKQKSICIIGMGVFGSAILEQLIKMNYRYVSIVDLNERSLLPYKSFVENSFVADATSVRALEEMGIENFDVVIVAASLNIEIIASLLEFNIGSIIARATNSNHTRVLKKIGVKMIVRPEEDSGIRTALIASNEKFLENYEDLIELGGDFVMGKTSVINKEAIGVPISQLPLENVNVIFIVRGEKYLLAKGDSVLETADVVNLFGQIDNVIKIKNFFSKMNENQKDN